MCKSNAWIYCGLHSYNQILRIQYGFHADLCRFLMMGFLDVSSLWFHMGSNNRQTVSP